MLIKHFFPLEMQPKVHDFEYQQVNNYHFELLFCRPDLLPVVEIMIFLIYIAPMESTELNFWFPPLTFIAHFNI